MKQFRMRNLCLSSLLLLLVACASTSYHKQKVAATLDFSETQLPILYKNSNPSPLYKTNVRLYGKEFGGLLLVKNMPDSSYRIVFTTETGIKLFDFQLNPDTFMVHFCIDKFNRDAVLSTIAEDIRLLLTEFITHKQAKKIIDKNHRTSFIFETGNSLQVYEMAEDSKTIRRIVEVHNKRKKVEINCSDFTANVPKQLSLHHYNLRLNIQLQLLER